MHQLKKYLSQHFTNKTLSAKDLTLFLRQFATLLSAGIPILTACQSLEKSQPNPNLRTLIQHIKQSLLSGKPLHESLHPLYFNQFTRSLIQLGEHTGTLATQLERLATYQEQQLALKKQFKQALFYPCFILCTAFLITIGLFLFVIPKFAELFQTSNVTLPLITQCLFLLSYALQQSLPWLCLAILTTVTLFLYYAPTLNYQKHLQNLPLLRTYLKHLLLIRFTRHLAITYTAGLPLLDALHLANTLSTTDEYQASLSRIQAYLSSGLRLHQAIELLPYYPPLLAQLIKTGEECGLLDLMLHKAADFLESELTHRLQTVTQLLEPLIMLILGVVIGGLVIGLYLPLFNVGSVL